MKQAKEIYDDIAERFKEKAGDSFGTVLNLYTLALAEHAEEIYKEIENNKTPHIWSSLSGRTLDDTGEMLNIPRDPDEDDNSYKYRLMQWKTLSEASNAEAINTALLNPEKARDASFVPKTNGCGTGTCYVIPREYTQENISESLAEIQERVSKVASPGLHIDYIIPQIKGISFEIYLKTSNGDSESIKEQITEEIRTYVNSIAPKDYLSVGEINKIGTNTSQVDYFNILSIMVNGVQTNKIKLLQKIDEKFIFDNIVWIGDSSDDSI